ncbi:TPA: antiviral RADAR system adenosine triphosphatase RdrA [Providencia alcalifaciens]
MSNEIILNLDLPEYQDEFYSSENNADKNELWQQDANKILISFLEKMGKNAQKYKQKCSSLNVQDISLNSYQHAIFISGDRGTGKTVFLRNAKATWEFHSKNDKEIPNLYFIDVIDPTLLNINDRFSEVIIASVYAAVDKKLKRPDIKQEKKDSFYSALKTLSSALGHPTEFDEFRGIDRIQKYRSGIHIERYFHHFLITSVDLLGCDALVLPIDDVDMKIENAFGVIDDIRCLLSCPLILPLVSGDNDMYNHITTMKFEESLSKRENASNFNDGKNMAEHLSNAYLTKVFPNHHRIPLVPIQQLLSKLKIKYDINKNALNNEITYSQYDSAIKQVFYPFCNGQERSTNWPQPENAREITQFIRLITPNRLKERLTRTEKMNANNEMLWREFSLWANSKQDGIALTNAESFLAINAMQASDEFDLKNIIAFNPLMQRNKYRWAKKDFYGQQIRCIKDLKAHLTNKNILDTVFSPSEDFPSGFYFESRDNNILRSLPPLELIMESMYINSEQVAKNKNNKNQNLLIALYTHHDYYSGHQNRRYHIFFSRAFEILFWSILAVTNNLPQSFLDKENFKSKLKDIFSRVPFYSSFGLNPTRVIDEAGDDNEPTEIVSDVNTSDIQDKYIDEFCDDIYYWLETYNQKAIDDKLVSPIEFNDKNLVPLLSLVFNKTFSQLNVLRSKIHTLKDEHLSDLSKRFEYIFINAITSFMREGNVVNTNVATSAMSSTVRNRDGFLQVDRTLSRNIAELNLLNDSPVPTKNYAKLIKVIWEHPIFNLNLSTLDNYLSIGSDKQTNNTGQKSNTNTNTNFNNMSKNGLIDYYKKSSDKQKIIIPEVKKWAKDNSIRAKAIYHRIRNDDDLYINVWGLDEFSRLYKGIVRALKLEV